MAIASLSISGAQAGAVLERTRISGAGLCSPRSGGSVRVVSGDFLVNSLKVGLSGPVVRDEVFLNDVRWRGRVCGDVRQCKRLVARARAVVRLT